MRGTCPPPVRQDAEAYAPFEEAFSLQVLQHCGSHAQAAALEAQWTRTLQSDGVEGCNTLRGNPPASRRGWAVIRGAKK